MNKIHSNSNSSPTVRVATFHKPSQPQTPASRPQVRPDGFDGGFYVPLRSMTPSPIRVNAPATTGTSADAKLAAAQQAAVSSAMGAYGQYGNQTLPRNSGIVYGYMKRAQGAVDDWCGYFAGYHLAEGAAAQGAAVSSGNAASGTREFALRVGLQSAPKALDYFLYRNYTSDPGANGEFQTGWQQEDKAAGSSRCLMTLPNTAGANRAAALGKRNPGSADACQVYGTPDELLTHVHPGDICLNGSGSGQHIAMVKSVNKDGSFTLVEGNMGDQIQVNTYKFVPNSNPPAFKRIDPKTGEMTGNAIPLVGFGRPAASDLGLK